MTSVGRGAHTSGAEVTNISVNGLWLLIDGHEIFLAFAEFPWFQEATVAQLTRVDRPSTHHLYWPDLDVDLATDSLAEPERYPLVSRMRSNKRLLPAGRANKKPLRGERGPRQKR